MKLLVHTRMINVLLLPCLAVCNAFLSVHHVTSAYVTQTPSFQTNKSQQQPFVGGSAVKHLHPRALLPTTFVLHMNMFSDLGDMLSGGKLVPQTSSFDYGDPLGETSAEELTLAIQERTISFTGEDFDVSDAVSGGPYCRIRGAMLHLPGKDKMRVQDARSGNVMAVLDRKLMAVTPTYDILRGGDLEKIGWIEKEQIALTDTFDVFVEKTAGGKFGPFKPPAAYKLEGDFLDRRFVMKNQKGEVVAKVSKDQLIEFDFANHYGVQVAPGMDPILVISCACAIDEEFDEEHKKKREQEKR